MPSKEARTAQRREQILDAAARVFADTGFHEAGIADIAAALGIGHGTVYRYFENKQDLADRILERVVQHISAAILHEDPEAADTLADYREQVVRIINRLMDVFDTHPHLLRFFHQRSVSVDADALAAALDMFSDYTSWFLRNGVRKGFLRPDIDTRLVAQALVAVLLDLTRRASLTELEPGQRDRWIASAVDTMFHGIAPHDGRH